MIEQAQGEGMKLCSHFEMVEKVMNSLQYISTEVMKATAVSAIYYSTDEYGNVTHTTLDRLYKKLSDDYDITVGGAESRISTLKRDMLNTMSTQLKLEIFGTVDKIPNYIFILKLSEYVIRHW